LSPQPFFAVALLAIGSAVWTASPPATALDGAVMRLRLPGGGGERLGTAVLVDREPLGQGVALYFLTAASLIDRAAGVHLTTYTDSVQTVGVLRIVADHDARTPQPVVFSAPNAGEGFAILGLDSRDEVIIEPQHVTLRSARRIVGDRRLSRLVGCLGAPAVAGDGTFGIVTECEGDGPPIVTPLAAVRALLSQQVPRFGAWAPLSR